ncbi:cytochrome b561 [Cronobacter turicensis]|uniref:cytochrome b561 n=1 Tax=unclassified Cronobacter TaxID=2649764 RepID=UPI0013EE112D|nr:MULTISPECIES: cytochrome b561 [unclassified Cronobacter]ELQ6226401.1 cytochrome b561 [Cronobacter turicensis]KAF6596700.1 cytochrome b561 [Cronobacter sp. EKM101R]KAF6599526.1 cytochrome b561 [Cronobacter sp. EKM102R]HDI3023294.1 cytochrome b561 [Cronobacter turicensis]
MRSKYTSLQITLHWLVFLLVVMAYAAMELRGLVPRPLGRLFIWTHFSCGIAILALMVTRLLVRMKYPAPPIVPKPRAMYIGLSHLVHLVIYLMFIGLPLLGIVAKYYGGSDWYAFGISMPVAAEPDEDREMQLRAIHAFIANLSYFVIGLHAAAALVHHYFWKDNTLLRMMPGKRD